MTGVSQYVPTLDLDFLLHGADGWLSGQKLLVHWLYARQHWLKQRRGHVPINLRAFKLLFSSFHYKLGNPIALQQYKQKGHNFSDAVKEETAGLGNRLHEGNEGASGVKDEAKSASGERPHRQI